MLSNHPISEKLYLNGFDEPGEMSKGHKMQNEQQEGETVSLWILSQTEELVLCHG